MTLDEAWAEAEAALPEGWALYVLDQHRGEWRATAGRIEAGYDNPFIAMESGPTPATALHALAIALRTREGEAG